MCSRLSVDTAPASEWRCSRGRALSVSHCHDDRGAGVSDANPDFWVRINSKREDGRENGLKELDAGDFQPIGTPDTERNDQEKPRTRKENPDGVRTAGDTRNQESREDTLRNRHVPGELLDPFQYIIELSTKRKKIVSQKVDFDIYIFHKDLIHRISSPLHDYWFKSRFI
ncbi:hypothetical protein NDU88_004183 [Pleurodeles waltl]|uniref:Uncharacterized protein n=1 Tax=Pleurodeles waltl TaxID=8319 RepID=A0AAV7WUC8_PLEWA|nr:hypothetical protein NDU88_004183 [Pleurodeles waltl]